MQSTLNNTANMRITNFGISTTLEQFDKHKQDILQVAQTQSEISFKIFSDNINNFEVQNNCFLLSSELQSIIENEDIALKILNNFLNEADIDQIDDLTLQYNEQLNKVRENQQINKIVKQILWILNATKEMQEGIEFICEKTQTNSKQLNDQLNELENKEFKQDSINQDILEKFQSSINELKITPLHEAIKQVKGSNQSEVFLIDVYYDPIKMIKWKDNCVKNSIVTKKKVQKLSESYSNLFKVISEIQAQKDDFTKYNELVNDFEMFLTENSTAEANDFQTFLDIVKKAYVTNCLLINYLIKDFLYFIDNQIQLENAIQIADQSIKNLENNFKSLLRPGQFLKSYPQILKEINRRNLYNNLLQDQQTKLKHIQIKETELREDFIKSYGEIVPIEFLPQLQLYPPQIIELHNSEEENLPKVYDWLPHDHSTTIEEIETILNTSFSDYDLLPEKQKLNKSRSLNSSKEEGESQLHQKYEIKKQKNQKLKSKVKHLKKSIDNSKKVSQDLNKHLKELTQNYNQDIELKTLEIQQLKNGIFDKSLESSKNQEDRVARMYRLLSGICQTNYQHMQEIKITPEKQKSGISKQLEERVKQLEQENLQLLEELKVQNQKPSQDSLIISKADHLDFINNIHSLHKQDLSKLKQKIQSQQEEYNEVNQDMQRLRQEYEKIKDKAKSYQEQITQEKVYRVSAQNELQYKKLEVEKLQEDHFKYIKDLKLKQEQRISNLQKEIVQKETQVDQVNQKIQEYQQKLRDFQRDLDEQTKSYQRKLNEKKIEIERIKNQVDKSQKDLQQKDKEINDLGRKFDKEQQEKFILQDKVEQIQKQLDSQKCQIQNIMIVNQNAEKSLQSKSKELQDLQTEQQHLITFKNELMDKYDQLKTKYNKDIGDMNQKIELKVQENQAKFQHQLQDAIEKYKKQFEQNEQLLIQQRELLENDKIYLQEANQELLSQIQEQQLKIENKPTTIDKAIDSLNITCYDNDQVQSMIKEQQLILRDELHQYYEDQSLKQLEELVKINGIEIGCRTIFLPFGSGLYAAMDLTSQKQEDQTDLLSTAQSKSTRISKENIQCKYFLDLQSLSQKTQQILKNYEMIVIGRILDIEKKVTTMKELMNDEDDNDEQRDIIQCKIVVDQLLAFQDLEFTIYNYTQNNQ